MFFKIEVDNIINMTKYVKGKINDETVFEIDLKKDIANYFMINKLSNHTFDLIKEILKYRYSVNVTKIKIKSLNKLEEGLW